MEKLQFRILYRQFLFRMVDPELLSAHAQGDMSKLLGQFAALLVFLGLGLASFGFGWTQPAWPHGPVDCRRGRESTS